MTALLFLAAVNLAFFAGCWWASRKKAQDADDAFNRGFAEGRGASGLGQITIRCNCSACSARRTIPEARA